MAENTGVVYQQWNAPSARAVLLLVHGLGGHTGRWEFLSRFFLQYGISSYAIELKGFGNSQAIKGHIDSLQIYFDDIRALRDIIKKEHPAAKCFFVGESLGGLLVFLLSIMEPGLSSGLICISPAFKSRLKFTFLEYIKIFSSFFFCPRKQFVAPFNSRMFTRDSAYQAVIEQDKREHHLVSARLLVNTLIAQIQAAFLKHKLKIPALFLTAGKDYLIDSKTIAHIFDGLGAKDKTIIKYEDMYHALSIDVDREKVFADILKWLQERI